MVGALVEPVVTDKELPVWLVLLEEILRPVPLVWPLVVIFKAVPVKLAVLLVIVAKLSPAVLPAIVTVWSSVSTLKMLMLALLLT